MIFTKDDVNQILNLVSESEELREKLSKCLTPNLIKKFEAENLYDVPLRQLAEQELNRGNISIRSFNALVRSIGFWTNYSREHWRSYSMRDLMTELSLETFDDIEHFFWRKVRGCGKPSAKELRNAFEKALTDGGILDATNKAGPAEIPAD